MYCPNCGKESKGSYCEHCGKPMVSIVKNNKNISPVLVVIIILGILLFLLLVYMIPDEVVYKDKNTTEVITTNEKVDNSTITTDHTISETTTTSTTIKKTTKKTYDLSSNEFIELMKEIGNKSLEKQTVYTYVSIGNRTNYLTITYSFSGKPTKKEVNESAKAIVETIIAEMKNNNYKNGFFLKNSYDYINIYFYYFDQWGEPRYNSGPFAQIEIKKIQDVEISDVFREIK